MEDHPHLVAVNNHMQLPATDAELLVYPGRDREEDTDSDLILTDPSPHKPL